MQHLMIEMSTSESRFAHRVVGQLHKRETGLRFPCSRPRCYASTAGSTRALNVLSDVNADCARVMRLIQSRVATGANLTVVSINVKIRFHAV